MTGLVICVSRFQSNQQLYSAVGRAVAFDSGMVVELQMDTMKDNKIILSIHDVTPVWRDEIEHAVALIEACDCPPPALLVVPHFHRKALLSDHTDFVRRLKEQHRRGSELFLHGYRHMEEGPPPKSVSRRLRAALLTAGEGEFLDLTAAETRSLIDAGIDALQILDAPLTGFVAPAWLYNRHLFSTLEDVALPFVEGHLRVYHLPSRQRFFVPAVSFCARGAIRSAGSVRYALMVARAVSTCRGLRFRLALHPADFRHRGLVDAIRTLLLRISDCRGFTTYRDLLITDAQLNGERP